MYEPYHHHLQQFTYCVTCIQGMFLSKVPILKFDKTKKIKTIYYS